MNLGYGVPKHSTDYNFVSQKKLRTKKNPKHFNSDGKHIFQKKKLGDLIHSATYLDNKEKCIQGLPQAGHFPVITLVYAVQ